MFLVLIPLRDLLFGLVILALFVLLPSKVYASPLDWKLSRASVYETTETTFIKVNPVNLSEVFASVRLPGDYDLLKSSDGGLSWQSLRQSMPAGLDVNWITIPAGNPNFVAVSLWGAGILTSSDGGFNWTKIFNSGSPRSVDIDETNILRIFVGIGGDNSGDSGLYRTNNGGSTWSKVVALGSRNNAQIHIDKNNTNRIFADADPYFYRSTDWGDSWSFLSLTNAFSIGTVIDNDYPNIIYTGGWGINPGPYKSFDNGDTWILKNNGFGIGYVFAFVKDAKGSLYVSRRNGAGSIWRSTNKAESWENVGDPAWGERNTWGLDVGGDRIFVAVEGLGIYYADLNAAPPPPPSTPNPVVIIPGFGASWSYKGLIENKPTNYSDWRLLPFFTDNIYGPLLSAFKESGFVENTNLFVFAYDFRKSITDSAQSLKQFIDQEVVPRNPGKKINVIAHSMGGLVARQCIEKTVGCSDEIDKTITGGSPHQGTLKAYKLWEGGVVEDDNVVTRTIEEAAITALNPIFLTRKDIIQNRFPGVRDFLPIFDYISGRPYIALSPQAKNQNLTNLVPVSDVFAGNLLALSGNSNATELQYNTTDPKWWEKKLGLWADGKPVSNTSGLGDGTVLKMSSEVLLASNKHYSLEHVDYFRDQRSINDIFSYLGLLSPSVISAPPLIMDVLAFVIHSPATILVKDRNGNVVGHNDAGKAVFVSNPKSSDYSVTVSGTGAGDYVLETFYLTDKTTFRDTFAGSIKPGQRQTIKFKTSGGSTPQIGESSSFDLYQSLLSRLKQIDHSDKIAFKIKWAIEGILWQSWFDRDEETERERFDTSRDNLRFALLLSSYRDIGKILAGEIRPEKREVLKEALNDLLELTVKIEPGLKISKNDIQQKIGLLNKSLADSKIGSLMAEGLNYLQAQEYLSRAQVFLNAGENERAYLLTFLISILITKEF